MYPDANDTLKYEIKDNKIAYKEQDGVVTNVSYGYKTVFSYFEEYEKKNITTLPESVTEIGVKICEISYSEVVKGFKYILGVSGTLTDLSDQQKNILQEEYKVA